MRHTLVSNKIKNTSKIPKSHNSKDSVTFVMTSCEAKCVTSEISCDLIEMLAEGLDTNENVRLSD